MGASWRPGRIFDGLLSPDVLGRVVGIKGRTGLLSEEGHWRLGETRLLQVQQKQAAAAGQCAFEEQQEAPELRLPTGGERRHVLH